MVLQGKSLKIVELLVSMDIVGLQTVTSKLGHWEMVQSVVLTQPYIWNSVKRVYYYKGSVKKYGSPNPWSIC